jgi:hypothetical protein
MDEKLAEIERLKAEVERLRSVEASLDEMRNQLIEILDVIRIDPEGAAAPVLEGFRRHFAKAPASICSYCGLMISHNDPDQAKKDMRDHILTCPENPFIRHIQRISIVAEGLRAVLKLVEWDNEYYCLICGGSKPVHAADCALKAALKGGE